MKKSLLLAVALLTVHAGALSAAELKITNHDYHGDRWFLLVLPVKAGRSQLRQAYKSVMEKMVRAHQQANQANLNYVSGKQAMERAAGRGDYETASAMGEQLKQLLAGSQAMRKLADTNLIRLVKNVNAIHGKSHTEQEFTLTIPPGDYLVYLLVIREKGMIVDAAYYDVTFRDLLSRTTLDVNPQRKLSISSDKANERTATVPETLSKTLKSTPHNLRTNRGPNFVLSASGLLNNDFPAWRAMDGHTSHESATYYHSHEDSANNLWWQICFNRAVKVHKVKITTRGRTWPGITNLILEYSDNGLTYTFIGNVNLHAGGKTDIYTVETPQRHRYWRLRGRNQKRDYLIIDEIEFIYE